MAMFVVHSCSTYQCWHMPDAIPCVIIGPCFSIHQLVNVLGECFEFYFLALMNNAAMNACVLIFI